MGEMGEIDLHTDIKDAILCSPTGYLTSKSLVDSHKLLGITVPTMLFMLRYRMLFEEYPHPKFASLACFNLTKLGKMMYQKELELFEQCQDDIVERLSRLIMMTWSQMVPLQSLHRFKWDLGLPDDFDRNLIQKYPDHFRVVKGTTGMYCLKLLQWREEYSVSQLQKINEKSTDGNNGISAYKNFKSGKAALEFPMSFPRGYGAQKKGESVNGLVSKSSLHLSLRRRERN